MLCSCWRERKKKKHFPLTHWSTCFLNTPVCTSESLSSGLLERQGHHHGPGCLVRTKPSLSPRAEEANTSPSILNLFPASHPMGRDEAVEHLGASWWSFLTQVVMPQARCAYTKLYTQHRLLTVNWGPLRTGFSPGLPPCWPCLL